MRINYNLRLIHCVVLVTGLTAATGCTHNHYYGALPACGPAVQSMTNQVGPVCEIPAEPGTVVSSASSSSGVVVRTNPTNPFAGFSPNPQKVVISQPASGPALARNPGRFNNWRRPDPEGLATIRTEGGLNDDTIQR